MKSRRKSGTINPDSPSTRTGAQLGGSEYQTLLQGWHQAQEFWNHAARSWGEATGTWLGLFNRSGANREIIRELQEATLAVAQAWMRLPLVFTGGARRDELQTATMQLTKAQGRAYQLWLEALKRSSAISSAERAAKSAGKKKQ